MPRALTVSRVRVRQGSEREYLAAIGELTALAETRGWHLWLFRSPSDPELFLECSESRSLESHRIGPDDPTMSASWRTASARSRSTSPGRGKCGRRWSSKK